MRVDVKVAIVKSGMKQYEIAQELGIPESTLSKFVRGYGVLSPDHASRLAQIIGLTEEGRAGVKTKHGYTPNAN